MKRSLDESHTQKLDSEESKCMWTHGKEDSMWWFQKSATIVGVRQERWRISSISPPILSCTHSGGTFLNRHVVPSSCVHIYFLLIKKDICDCENVSFKLLYACVCLKCGDFYSFSVRVSPFLSLYYPYFGAYFSLWSVYFGFDLVWFLNVSVTFPETTLLLIGKSFPLNFHILDICAFPFHMVCFWFSFYDIIYNWIVSTGSWICAIQSTSRRLLMATLVETSSHGSSPRNWSIDERGRECTFWLLAVGKFPPDTFL